MKTSCALLALALAALCTPAQGTVVSDSLAAKSHDVTWKQTRGEHLSQSQGALGSSVGGHFPFMSKDKIGMGCGIDWKHGQLHAGFDVGDANNGVGGGFVWTQKALSSIVGVHFKETRINLNLTITEENEVVFNVNGKELVWEKVMKQEKKEYVLYNVGKHGGKAEPPAPDTLP